MNSLRVRSLLFRIMACALMILPCGRLEAAPRPEMITPQAEKAIERGVTYLVRTQAHDGSWDAGGSGRQGYLTVMTSLAGLALMAAGNTPVEGRYADNVRRAVDFIISSAQPSGLITQPGEESRSMYGHGFSMLFLGEAYGMERDPERQALIRRILDRAVELTSRSQSKDGGWLYTPDQNSDEGSVTVTQIQGLRACRNAGIKVPKQTIEKAVKYIARCQNKDGGISYSLRNKGSSRPAISAAAVAVLYNAGEYDHPAAGACLKYVKKNMVGKKGGGMARIGGHQFYTMLYLSQAMYLSGDEGWKDYFSGERDKLLKLQDKDGSWMGDGIGTTYGTAIALLILQLPYRQLPILQR